MAKCLTQRADIALLSEQRMTNWKISDKVDLPVNQVGKWRRRFLGQVESLNAVAQECKTRPIGTRVIAVDGTPQAGQTARHRLGIIGRRDSVSASFFLLRREAAYHRINRD